MALNDIKNKLKYYSDIPSYLPARNAAISIGRYMNYYL